MSQTPPPARKPVWRRLAWLLAALLAAGLVLAAAAWLMRQSLAEALTARWCQNRGLVCEAQFETVSARAIALSRLEVRSGGHTPLETGPLRAELAWPGIFRPRVTAVSVDRPVVRLGHDGRRLDMRGLGALSDGRAGQAGFAWPRVAIEQGRAEIDTPAGRLLGDFSLSAAGAENLEGAVRVRPARLSSDEGEIAWTRGDLELEITDGHASGDARLEIEQARLGASRLRDARLEARLAPLDDDGPIMLDWESRLEEAASGPDRVSGVYTRGSLTLDRVEISGPSALLRALSDTVFSVEAESARIGGLSGENVRFDADLSGDSGGLAGPLALEAGNPHYRGHQAEELALTGQALLGRDGSGALDGRLVLKSAKASPEMRSKVAQAFEQHGVFHDHGAQLGDEIVQALGDFDVGLDLAAERSPNGDFALTGVGETHLRSGSGLTAQIVPFGNTPWLEVAGDEIGLRGDLRLRAARTGLDLSARVDRFLTSPAGSAVIASDLVLRRYEAGELALALDLESLSFDLRGLRMKAAAAGIVTLDGQLPGARLSATSLFGGIDAVRGVEGWRIQTTGARCLGLETAGAVFQSVRLGEVALTLCPKDGRFLQQRGGHPEGVVSLGHFSLPFSTGRSAGSVAFGDARLEWLLDDGLFTRLSGDGLTWRVDTGQETLSITGEAPALEASAGPGPLRIAGGLRDMRISGSLVPARVTAARADFVLNDDREGPAGQAALETVRIKDPGEDPVFQPLLASAQARLDSGALRIDAALRLADTGLMIGRGELELSFPGIDGTGVFRTEPLRFRPGMLQPHDLSERLRGFFTDARGEASASAEFVIRGGEVIGRGRASLRDFGFQTLAFSRVRGVTGDITFDSLFPLSTPPAQLFTVEEIDPGIALENGEVRFRLVEGREARLERARWPFAGGELFVEPSVWTVAGEQNTVTVRADNVSLAALSETLSVPGLVAEGTVSGRFPVEFSGGSAFIRDARLVADTAGGRLSYTGRLAEQAASTDENVALAFRALEDFDFRVLEIGADGDIAGDIVLSARLLGHNDTVLGGSEFDFNIRLDSRLSQLLASSRQWTGTGWLADVEARRKPAGKPTGD